MRRTRTITTAVGALTGLLLSACGGPGATDDVTVPGVVASDAPPPGTPRTPLPSRVTSLRDEPVLTPAGGERWTNPGWTVEVDGEYWMFQNSFSAFPGDSRVDLLRSSDLATWEPVGDDPLLTNVDVPFADGKTAFVMSGFVADDGTWTAIVSTHLGTLNPSPIGRATAPGPEGPWTVDPEPILVPGEAGTFDARRMREPSVIWGHDGTYRLYYTGYDDVDGTGRIGVATSEDGATWTKRPGDGYGGSVIEGTQSWTQGEAGGAQVTLTDDGYVMVYDSADLQVFGAGIAVSEDGYLWTSLESNPILTDRDAPASGQFYQSEVLANGGTLTWLLEASNGQGTQIHLLEIDLAASLALEPSLPTMTATWRQEGADLVIDVEAQGFDVGFVEGDVSGATAHLHAYVDRPAPRDGDTVRTNSPTIVHSETSTIRVADLSPGDHTIWVVAADGADEVVLPPQPLRLLVTIV